MSYTSIAEALRSYLVADSALADYNHEVDVLFQKKMCSKNRNMLIEIAVPEEESFSDNLMGDESLHTKENTCGDAVELNAALAFFQIQKYIIRLKAYKMGLSCRYELEGVGNNKTIFDFRDAVINSIMQLAWANSADIMSIDIGNSELNTDSDDKSRGDYLIKFMVLIEEEVSTT